MVSKCPLCGEPTIGPLMFGEVSCSDNQCEYWYYEDQEESTEIQGEN